MLGGLAACANLSKGIADDGASARQLVWPKASDTNGLARGGTYVTPETLGMVHPGMNKSQLQQLLGPPHFGEGLVAVREWNYLFHLRRAGQADFQTCQLKILFDRHAAAGSLYWLPANCAQPPLPEPKWAVYASNAQALFGFDQASMDQASVSGRRQLAALVRQLKRSDRSLQSVQVLAYTDRLGSAEYNRDLSLRRAHSVGDYLVAQGIPADRLQMEGKGASDPVSKNCPATLSQQALIDCLAPDRRVVVKVRWVGAGPS